jgi:hypothetical protein
MKNTSARLSRLSELYLKQLGAEEALVLTTPVRHFQRLAFRAERRAYKRYAIVFNVNSRGLCYQAKHLLANWWLKHYGLVEAAHPHSPTSPPVTLHSTRRDACWLTQGSQMQKLKCSSSLAEGVTFAFLAFTNESLC